MRVHVTTDAVYRHLYSLDSDRRAVEQFYDTLLNALALETEDAAVMAHGEPDDCSKTDV